MRRAAPSRPVEKLFPSERPIDPQIAEQVGQEILHNRLEPAAWANALAASGGKRQDALAAYARIRMHQVASLHQLRRAKSQSFEARRLTTCLGIKTVQDLLNRSNRGGQLNLVKPRLSLAWLAILLFGSAGSAACIGRLLGDRVPDRLESWVPAIALFCGLIVVTGVLTLRAFLPKRWIMLGWNNAMTAVCTIACFASLCFGAKLIARTSPEVFQRLTSTPQPAPLSAPVMVKPNPGNSPLASSTAAMEMDSEEE